MNSYLPEGPRQQDRFGIAEKGLFVFALWAIIQTILVLSLCNLRTTGDIYALNTGRAREASLEVRDIICLDTSILLRAEKSLELGQPLDAGSLDDLAKLQLWTNRLKELLRTPEDSALLDQIGQTTDNLVREVNQVKSAAQLPRVWNRSQAMANELQELLFKLTSPKRLPLILPSAQQSQLESLWFNTAITLSVANLLGLIAIGFFFSRSIIERLVILTENSARLLRGARLLAPLPGSDEVANLDQAFHRMADSLIKATLTERALFENATDILCHMDSAYHLMNVNTAAAKVLGYQPSELLGMRLVEIIYPPDRDQAIERLEAIARKGTQEPFEPRIIKKNGSILHTLWSVRYVRGESTFFCVVHDVSERKAADELRRQVVQMVNRDLRSPLSAIQAVYANLETGLLGQLNEKGERNLAMAHANTERMLRLINDLLDLEKLEAGMLTIKCETISLPNVVTEALEGIAMLAQQKNIVLEKRCADLTIYADRHRIIQVIINLLGNAIKFSPNGGKILVSAQDTGRFVEISVIDQGRGIPPHLTKVIFDRFRQVQTSDATVKGGSGLGLAICKALIELHGGEIGVESKEGEGSRFYFRVPKQ